MAVAAAGAAAGGWWIPLAISAGTSLLGGRKAKKDAARQAEQKRMAIAETSAEKIRRRTLEQGQELGQGVALMGAANIQHVSDTGYDKVLKDMQVEFGKEISWMKRATQFEQIGVDAELRSAKSAINTQGIGNVLDGLMMSGSSKGWW